MIISGDENGKAIVWPLKSSYVPALNPLFSLRKDKRNTSIEYFQPFGLGVLPVAMFLPKLTLGIIEKSLVMGYPDKKLDLAIITIDDKSNIKIYANFIEYDTI